ncbi:MAG: DUF1385 domain-containing protein [Anaerolineae bacterium]|nr:DUF1385 domain-containing protein [Anaerolineae bacterium]MBK9093096.1 DUF1385 domain-containing protein [Anaerolineae bacterium]MBK9230144.1 DUF1385 domain-containing protein [Anaerolineae bacterium]
MEGVMMRGRQRMVVAVRNPSGEIVIHEEPLTARIYTSSWGQWPFVRGLSLLWDTLGLGMRALMWSADVAMSEEEQKIEFSGPVAWTTVAFSLLVSIGLFFLLPTSIAHFLERWFPGQLASAAIEGVVRLGLFVAYLWVIGLMPDIRRVFMYHGAEHKTINAYEAGVALTPSEVRKFTVQHPRCGTSFLFIVVALSIVLFAPFHFDQWYLRLASRLLLIPVLAGIAYEFIRYTASHLDNRLVRALIQPGLWLQGLTTREPDDSMLACAIAALVPVLAADGIQVEMPARTAPAAMPAPLAA